MAQNPELVSNERNGGDNINEAVKRIVFAECGIAFKSHHMIAAEQHLYTLELKCSNCQLSEFNNKKIAFLTTDSSVNSFLHGLITALINVSNEYVNEQLKYQGFARFSKHINVEKIGTLSVAMRSSSAIGLCSLGKQHANKLNFEIDSGRAPQGCGQAIGGFLAAHGIEQPENAHLYPDYL
jgi:predicted nucleic-acid-binding Zn-ribbon protein